jgi:hypothetical protein
MAPGAAGTRPEAAASTAAPGRSHPQHPGDWQAFAGSQHSVPYLSLPFTGRAPDGTRPKVLTLWLCQLACTFTRRWC